MTKQEIDSALRKFIDSYSKNTFCFCKGIICSQCNFFNKGSLLNHKESRCYLKKKDISYIYEKYKNKEELIKAVLKVFPSFILENYL